MLLLIDNSAWARRHRSAVRGRFAHDMRAGTVATCLPFLLEAGFSTRSAESHTTIVPHLSMLPRIAMTLAVEQHALEAQAALAAVDHHRISPADILIAACAHEAGAGVLHYDKDYDVLREHTRLRFRSEWLAPAGSLD